MAAPVIKAAESEQSEAYLRIIDSLHIELIYSNIESYEKKCSAMLNVLSRAIKSFKF